MVCRAGHLASSVTVSMDLQFNCLVDSSSLKKPLLEAFDMIAIKVDPSSLSVVGELEQLNESRLESLLLASQF